jgi:outer membrane scaffolding protein for murein synthesis (MipA/OmpV family)
MSLKHSSRRLAIAASFLSGAAALFCGASARAADLPVLKEAYAPPTPDYIVTVEGMVGASPRYPGANQLSFFGLPGISIRRSDHPERFSSPDDSVSFALWRNEWLAVGPAGRWINNRSVKNNWQLFGMDSVDASIELGGYAEWTPVSWGRIRGEVRKAVTGYDGLAGSAIADVWQKWGPLTLSIGPRFDFGNNQYASAFFSVDPVQAALNQWAGGRLTPYNATGGLVAAGGTAAARYELSEAWRISGYVEYQVLTGSVANSPLVTHTGSKDQVSFGIELAYRFHTAAPAWVPAPILSFF